MTEELTVVDALELTARADPDRVVAKIDGHELEAGRWQEASVGLLGCLSGRGLEAGDRVATFLSNRPETLYLWLALARGGMVEVPINTAMKGDLLADQVRRARARLLVAEADLLPALEGSGLPVVPVEELLEESGPCRAGGDRNRPAPDDVSLILYTSGTTGASKGVVLTHRANTRLAWSVVHHVGLEADDVLYTPFPLFHIAARFVSVMPALLVGGRVVVDRHFSASGFFRTCRSEGVTAIHYLGTLPMMLFGQPPSPSDRDHRVRLAYGAGMPTEIWTAFMRRFGIERVYELYGSTEQGIVSITGGGEDEVGTCGRPVPDLTVEIHDPEDNPLPPGEPGEIVVRPERPGILFQGYDGMPEATLEAFRNLWFHTGDRGRIDQQGRLTFLGRVKDSIRRRGENISCFEVEQVLEAHPLVAEAAVVGVPSELGEEEVLAVVVAKGPLAFDELIAFCRERLPAFAVPRYLRLADSLPKNAAARVRKPELAYIDATTFDRDKGGLA
ncbi:MAG: ATP-dependent acyl-CoA ligase [Acidimicrobiia bacterium]|nr:MAG: ATP-dependent acyl-CoA ligase [Acidimicrobiia bacterium]